MPIGDLRWTRAVARVEQIGGTRIHQNLCGRDTFNFMP